MKRFAASILVFALSLLAMGSDPVRGQTPAPVSLNDLLVRARQANPEIAAAKAEWQAEEDRVLVARTWPDPMIGVMIDDAPGHGLNTDDAAEKGVVFQQDIPFPGKLSLKGRVAWHLARHKHHLFNAKVLAVTSEVKNAYWELYYLDQATRIAAWGTDLMDHLVRVAQTKYKTGTRPQSDSLRAQVNFAKVKNQELTLAELRKIAEGRLSTLLNQPPDAPLGPAQRPRLPSQLPDLKTLQETAQKRRPEIEAQEHEVKHAGYSATLARLNYAPDFTVTYARATLNGAANTDAQVMARVPLYFWKQNKEVQAAQAELESMKAMLESRRNETRFEVQDLYIRLQTQRRLVSLYATTILPQAKQNTQVLLAAYKAGSADFTSLLEAIRSYSDFKMEYARAEADMGVTLAMLERTIGGSLDDGMSGH